MLSAEELRLWDHVRSTKVDQLLESTQHLSRTRPVLEDDLAAAIGALKESTAVIEKQIDVLQRHQDFQLPDTLKRQPRRFGRTTLDLVHSSGLKDALELQQLRFALGEETEAFTSSLQSASEDASHVRNTTGGHLAQRLDEDDQKLDALQKLVLPCRGGLNGEIGSNQRASRLVTKLVDFTCEEIRCRLDRIYLEQLREPVSHENGIEDGPSMQEVSLKGDLETLYAEIRDVVAMSVSQEFEHPLLNSQRENRRCHKASEDLAYRSILSALAQSRQALEDATNNLESFHSYSTSLDVFRTIHKRIGTATELAPTHDPLFTSVAQASPLSEATLGSLLRYIGISNETFNDRRWLEHELSTKKAKLRGPAFYGASSTADSLRIILGLENASSELLSNTPQGQLQAVNPGTLDTNLGALDNGISFLKGKVESVDLSRIAEPSKTQKHFLDRWA